MLAWLSTAWTLSMYDKAQPIGSPNRAKRQYKVLVGRVGPRELPSPSTLQYSHRQLRLQDPTADSSLSSKVAKTDDQPAPCRHHIRFLDYTAATT